MHRVWDLAKSCPQAALDWLSIQVQNLANKCFSSFHWSINWRTELSLFNFRFNLIDLDVICRWLETGTRRPGFSAHSRIGSNCTWLLTVMSRWTSPITINNTVIVDPSYPKQNYRPKQKIKTHLALHIQNQHRAIRASRENWCFLCSNFCKSVLFRWPEVLCLRYCHSHDFT